MLSLIEDFITFLNEFGWIFLLIILGRITASLYLYFVENVRWWPTIKYIFLELKLPEEISKSPKAMESVFETLHGLWDGPNTYEKWIKGQRLLWYSIEMVGKGGDGVHLYMRVPLSHKNFVEDNLYAQYPEIEISERTDDYMAELPSDIPNEDYNLWGSDFKMKDKDYIPIRTYAEWQKEGEKAEMVIDPLASLFEFLSNLKVGEMIAIQILARPIIDERSWRKDAQAMIRKRMGYSDAKNGILNPLFLKELPLDISNLMLTNEPIPEREIKSPEARPISTFNLTPIELERMTAIERKLGKQPFDANIRFLYIAKRDVFFKPIIAGVFGHFTQFQSANLNALLPDVTKTKTFPYFFAKRRLDFKQRKLLRYFKARLFPWVRRTGYVMTSDELATIFHFPTRQAAPALGVQRAEIRPGQPPTNFNV